MKPSVCPPSAEPVTTTSPIRARWRARLRRPSTVDLMFGLLVTAVAFWLTGGLWPHPATTALALNAQDQALDEWFLANAARVYAGDLHLVTHLMNAPDGVNLMCNASLLALGVLFGPVTLAFGAPVSFALIEAVNLAATGLGWYLLFGRGLRMHRAAAAVGGLFTAFAPGMVAQSNGHPHITAQWLLPPIVWCLVRLAKGGPARRYGTALGVLIAIQLFVGEETLFLAVIALTVFGAVYLALGLRLPSRSLVAGLGLAVLVAGVLLAYPLWVQFRGPMSVPDGPFNGAFFSADLASFASISPLSLAGDPASAKLVSSPAEYTSFFGLPLILVFFGAVLWLWRRRAAVAAAVTALTMCALSLGPNVGLGGHATGVVGPFGWLGHLPVLDSALPTRFALAAIAPVAYILARTTHVALTETPALRLLVPVTVLAALVPLAPAPLPTQARTPVPRFFTGGYWRACVAKGGTLVPLPLSDGGNTDTLRWAAAAGDRFAVPQGWFIGPYADHGDASIGIYPRATAQLLSDVGRTGIVPSLGVKDFVNARKDVTYWHASCVVVADSTPHEAAVKSTVDQLYGPGERIADVWTWRVSP